MTLGHQLRVSSPNAATTTSSRKQGKLIASTATNVEATALMSNVAFRGKQGKLRFITELPLDLLYETFCHLRPADVLHLSQTSKAVRALLMTRSALFVWKSVRHKYVLNFVPHKLPDSLFSTLAALVHLIVQRTSIFLSTPTCSMDSIARLGAHA